MAPAAVHRESRPTTPGEIELSHEVDNLAQHLNKGVAVSELPIGSKPVKRRTTFSIAPEHMNAAKALFKQSVSIAPPSPAPRSFLGDLVAESQLRRDSGIDLDDSDEVLTPPDLGPDNDYTPREIPDAKDYMDNILRGRIKIPRSGPKKNLRHVQEQKKQIKEQVRRMGSDEVMVVKSGLAEIGSLALPSEIKT